MYKHICASFNQMLTKIKQKKEITVSFKILLQDFNKFKLLYFRYFELLVAFQAQKSFLSECDITFLLLMV